MIEKNLFFVATDKNDLNQDFIDNMDFVKKQNPSYKVRLIDFKDFEEYYKEKDIDSYNNYYCKLNKKIGAMVADYIRYNLLYYEGGVYIDIKSRPLIPLDELINDDDVARLIHWKHNQTKTWKREYSNAFIMFKKNDIIFKKVINKIHQNIDNYNSSKINFSHARKNVLSFTGPHLFTKVLDEEDLSHVRMIDNEERRKVYRCNAVRDYVDKYSTPHYSKLREHLIILN